MEWLQRKRKVIPLLGIGVTWLLYALIGEFRRPIHFLFCAVLSAWAFFALRLLMDLILKNVPDKADAEEKAEAADRATDEAISQEQVFLQKIETLDEQIPDVVISAQLKQIRDLVQLLFDAVKKQPEKKPDIQKFVDYYLPTTIQLLEKYVILQKQKISGKNIGDGMQKIADMLNGIIVALQKQLDTMFETDVIDLTAEIRVMEKKLAAEGLTAEKDF